MTLIVEKQMSIGRPDVKCYLLLLGEHMQIVWHMSTACSDAGEQH